MNIFGRELSARALRERTGDLESVAGVRQVELANGTERGVRAVELRTAAGLEVDVLVDRAMDLGAARFRGVPFGWRSGNGFRHPGLHEHNDEDGLSWLRALDGLLVSGGLDHTLFGGEVDASGYGYPPRQTVRHGLHGRLTAVPGRLLEAGEVWDGDHCVLRVRGEMVQATSFGEHLRLTRTVEVDFDGLEIRLRDVVDNLGFERTPHMFLYHLNFGWPLVEEGTEFLAPISGTLWQSDSVREQGVSYRHLPAPRPGFVEQVFEHRLVPDRDGRHRVALVGPGGGFGVEVAWDSAAMPHFFEWQNLRSGQYAVGLEPSTHHVAGDAAARDDGSMIWLEHGESRTYTTSLRVLDGVDATAAARARIRAVADQPE
ncbi:aldose 1-epimerase family protein [Streptomyces sp. NA04227]|uniref:aldose 1-epimerase family protein n=1 Tax=Streptomyces sp. NA04227 TaxID=2742136 RepID=UPI0015915D43|nr:aldose 1-epimerase family protein [Streptomyces sp. NA04227]QKW10369.1 aldose 1-epimerase family protein [Streptomyces sp. NA04227]